MISDSTRAADLLNSPTKRGETVGVMTLAYKVYWERYKGRALEFTLVGSKDPKDDIKTSFYGRVTGFTLNNDGNLNTIEGTNNISTAWAPVDPTEQMLYGKYKAAEKGEFPWKITSLHKVAKDSDNKKYELWEVKGFMKYYDEKSAKLLGKGNDYGEIYTILECTRTPRDDVEK